SGFTELYTSSLHAALPISCRLPALAVEPAFLPPSTIVTAAPPCAARIAAVRPTMPPPTTSMSVLRMDGLFGSKNGGNGDRLYREDRKSTRLDSSHVQI